MARLAIEGPDLVVRLSSLEKVIGLASDVRVPLTAITRVRVTDRPWGEASGFRVGAGFPFVILLGRTYNKRGKNFVAIYGRRPTTVVVELAPGQRYQRLYVSNVDEHVVEELRAQVAGP